MDRYIFNFRMEISALMRLNFEVIDMEPMKTHDRKAEYLAAQ